MKRWLLVTLFAALVISQIPQPALAQADVALWNAAGVTRLADRTEAPPVGLNDLAGQTVDLHDLRGRLVMLFFWATW